MKNKKALNIMFAISMIFIFWLFASTVEVVLKNNTSNPSYSTFNFFALFIKVRTFIYG